MQNKYFTAECAMLKAILEKTPMQTAIKWGAEVYTHKGKTVVSYGGFKNHFCLWFNNGVFLKDPYQVLMNANEEKPRPCDNGVLQMHHKLMKTRFWNMC